MDSYLKELCLEVLNQDLSSEKFASLLVETGIRLESLEWDIANKILERGDEINYLLKQNQFSLN